MRYYRVTIDYSDNNEAKSLSLDTKSYSVFGAIESLQDSFQIERASSIFRLSCREIHPAEYGGK